MDTRLKCSFAMLVVGGSGSGKSVFTMNLLQNKNQMMSDAPKRVVWCYSVWQPLYEDLQNSLDSIEFVHGIPSMELVKSGNFILVVDDLMDSEETSLVMSDIFTKYSHHYGITCIFILQNLFPKSKYARTISLNANYIVLMKNTRDRAQIRHLASQVFPGNVKYLVEAFEDATHEPFSYILLDFKPETPEQIRLRSKIFPNDTMVAYLKV